MKKDDTVQENLELKEQREIISEAVRTILKAVGEDPDREGLLSTPLRVAKAYEELLEGYSQEILDIVNGAMFSIEGQSNTIVVQDIPFDSMCEHHMLPFSGIAHVGYLPTEKVIGLSKIPRIVDMYARRLQIQERLSQQIADTLDEILSAKGTIVVIEGEHECAALRGVRKKNMRMKTIATTGIYQEDPEMKKEFLSMIG